MSEEALKIAEKRRDVKGIGVKERYTHLNAEFQRTARRDKRAFLRDQCKEIEENNRMGKTRQLFKKIRDIKRNFHAKIGSSSKFFANLGLNIEGLFSFHCGILRSKVLVFCFFVFFF